MYQANIETLAAQALEFFSQNGYTDSSLAEKRRAFCRIIELHKQHGSAEYNPILIDLFVKKTEEQYLNSEFSQIRFRFLTKAADYLTEYYNTGCIQLTRRDMSTDLSDYYVDILNDVLAFKEWSEKSRRHVWSVSKTFLKWLQSKDIHNLNMIDEKILREYLIDCSKRMNNNSLDTVKRSIKKLLVYLYETEKISESYEDTLKFSIPTERKIKKPIPLSEIADILGSIDCSTSIGKRDYAIILLATVTGLRSVDIVNLRLDEIDWINGEIKLIQSKTGKSLALPLTNDIGSAIENYILNGRPDSDEPFVFLREKSPHTQMGRSMPYLQFNGYRQKLGMPKAPFHGLRRTLGTNMVIAGVPVTTVAQVLGHSTLSSTKQYISLDSTHLKECALSLNDLYCDVKEADE